MTAPPGIRRILVPIDFSGAVPVLVRYAMEIVRGRGATVRLLHVVVPPALAAAPIPVAPADPRIPADLRAAAEEKLRAIAAGIRGLDVEVKVVFGVPSMSILREAREWEADVVVLATHGRTGLRRAFLGSVAEEVVRRCASPVLTVRAGGLVEESARAPREAATR